MRHITTSLFLLGLAACAGEGIDPALTADQIQLEWEQGETFFLQASYRVANMKGENRALPLVEGAAEAPVGESWTEPAVWVYQVVEQGFIPEEGDELYDYALDSEGIVREIDVVRAWLDPAANDDEGLLELDPVVYMVFRGDRDRLGALVSFVNDPDGGRTEYAYSSSELDKSWAGLSQSMLTDAPTFLAPFTATFNEDDVELENGSLLQTREVEGNGDAVDVFYDDELGGGLVVSRYERGMPWPTWTVTDNLDARLLSESDLDALRMQRRPWMMRIGENAPDDFDYRAALRATIDIEATLKLDQETIDEGWESFVYEEFTPWAGSWWPLATSKLVFGYDSRDTFSDRIKAELDPLARRRDEISAELRELSDGDSKRDELVKEYREKQDETVELLVGFYDSIRDGLDGGTIVISGGEIRHTVDGWAYDLEELSPFDKFGLAEYLRGANISNPFYLSAWELLNQYNPVGGKWWGKCNGWAAAAILANEPLQSTSVTLGSDNVTLEFTTADQKGLLASSFYGTHSSFYGARYDGEDDDITDLHPDAFHHIIQFYLREQKVPFVFDTTAGDAVWNYPVNGAKVVVTETTQGGGAGLIDVNTADAATLDTLPEIGEYLASKIIEYRLYVGPFQSVDDLEKVSGIGPATLEEIRPLVSVKPSERTFDVTATVTMENDAVPETHLSTMRDTTFTKVWRYTLTTDSNLNVLKGEWAVEDEHPDFAWVPYDNPRARASGGSENPFLEYAAYLDIFGEDVERR